MKFNLIQLSAALFLSASLVSCSKDDDEPSIKPYTVPDTYTFDNVEYSESAARISMFKCKFHLLQMEGYLECTCLYASDGARVNIGIRREHIGNGIRHLQLY